MHSVILLGECRTLWSEHEKFITFLLSCDIVYMTYVYVHVCVCVQAPGGASAAGAQQGAQPQPPPQQQPGGGLAGG